MKLRTTHEHRRTGRWFAAAMGALLALCVPLAQSPALAAIEVGSPVYVGAKQGYGGTGIFPIWAETPPDPSAPGEPEAWAYCLENQVSARTGVTGRVGDLSSYLGSNYFTDPTIQGKVLWLLAHSYPALSLEEFGAASGVPGISRNDAIEATQYAIWRYTDLTFDADWFWETPDSEAAYWYLVNGANASSGATPADFAVTASITGPTTVQSGGSLIGPFTVSTNQPSVAVTVDPTRALTDSAGAPIDATSVHNGDEIFLDLRASHAAGSATVSVAAAGASSTGTVVSVPTPSGSTPSAADHAQSMVLVAPSTATTRAAATVEWAAAPGTTPTLATSLVDASDQDRVLAWNGGTVVDTVTFQNLVPGTEYTVRGELMRQSDASGTGLTGTTTFTPSTANGSVTVTFVVPKGYAGDTLVAFEWLFEGPDATGQPIAQHTDISDPAQTISVQQEPRTPGVPTSPTDPGSPVTPTQPTVPSAPITAGTHSAPAAQASPLAHTGSDNSPALVGIAAVALIAGAALMCGRRRRTS
ncbi:LPXTG-motif cell wall-anchored protein/TQXA domain-containing protein [Leucobacter luti]|uniref:LPXTG-motif cell wall-anchored protein/TQXA domain-containing protein n=1 Tax=Leucobacter luti TaxID=340320 RepID=A0A4R6RX26_9MICO|nr:VaFE repeat-containing surface-anchored protein [Leucobacter luti]TDP90885.1 LPXTG-motif cell wall-anchored protein/TQXA domain-containing protein [Leucobacter luti]